MGRVGRSGRTQRWMAGWRLVVVLGSAGGCATQGGSEAGGDTEPVDASTGGSGDLPPPGTGSTAARSDTTEAPAGSDGDAPTTTSGDTGASTGTVDTSSTAGDGTTGPGVDDTVCPDPAHEGGRAFVLDPAPPSLTLFSTTGEIVVRGEEGRTTVDIIPHGLGGGSPPLVAANGYHASGSDGLLALVPPDLLVSANSGNGSQCASGHEGDLYVTTGSFGSALVHARFSGDNVVDVAAGNGDVTLTMRVEQGATLVSAATGGVLTIEVPFTGRATEQVASGELGNGTPAGEVSLSSFTGAIVIEPR